MSRTIAVKGVGSLRVKPDYVVVGLELEAKDEVYERANRHADFLVGIGGVVTFKNASLAKTLERIPPERILLETDAPYLAPVPWRGRRNESAYLPLIADKVARIKGLSLEQIETITTHNAETLFGI